LKSPYTCHPRTRSAVEMTGGGHLWKTGIAHAMGASRRFPTAAHHPWKTLRVSHIPTAPAILFSLFKLKNERPRRARRLTSVQAHLSMRICCLPGRHAG
jgi:hypothetical protein